MLIEKLIINLKINQLLYFSVKFEIFTDCECTKDAFLNVAKCLADRYHISRLNVYNNTDELLQKGIFPQI